MLWQQGATVVAEPSYIESPQSERKEGSFVSFETVETLKRYFYMGSGIGPMPMHDVVVMAVRNAVSAATTTFTSVSMILLLFIAFDFFILNFEFP